MTLFLTVLCSVNASTILPGLMRTSVKCMDSGWIYENGEEAQLPTHLKAAGDKLCLTHKLSDVTLDDEDVLVFRTRYDSIRVWADDVLIYESIHGKEHVMGSQWHFVPVSSCLGASMLRVEFTRYEEETGWELAEVLMDNPDTVWVYLIRTYIPAVIFWFFSVLFTLLLIFISFFMIYEKMPGVLVTLSLAAFVFLSGQWILLDSKITTLFGGNYARTYFFSYCAFYLLLVPFLFYIRLILESRNRVLIYLPLAFVGNAALSMSLHLTGLVPIHKTTVIVHILMVLSIVISMWELFRSGIKGRRTVTFFGILFVLVDGLLSLILYYTDILPSTNNAMLYSWAFLVLILCMAMDIIFSFGRFYKQKQYMDHYRQLAMQDSMTLVENRNAYELYLQKLSAKPPHKLTIILFDVDNLKTINDVHGHHMGDQVIYLSAQCIRETFEASGRCFRIGGDEYCVIITSDVDVQRKLQRLDVLFESRIKEVIFTTISYGWAEKYFCAGEKDVMDDILALKEAADSKLYEQKKKHKQMEQINR